MPVRLVADGEAGQVLPVVAPDVAGGLGIDRFQVRDRIGGRVEQAERVNDPHPGRGGKGKQVVDPAEAIAAGARRRWSTEPPPIRRLRRPSVRKRVMSESLSGLNR